MKERELEGVEMGRNKQEKIEIQEDKQLDEKERKQ